MKSQKIASNTHSISASLISLRDLSTFALDLCCGFSAHRLRRSGRVFRPSLNSTIRSNFHAGTLLYVVFLAPNPVRLSMLVRYNALYFRVLNSNYSINVIF